MCLTPVPECSCGYAKTMAETLDSTRLIQFLMGLNDAYDSIRGQILLLEPLPNVSKAYAMVLRVEKQREVNQVYTNNQENNAFLVKMQQSNNYRGRGRGRSNQSSGRGRGRNNDRSGKFCDFCNTPGHLHEACFHLNCFPDWYQQYKTQKEGANVTKTEVNKSTQSTPFDYKNNAGKRQDTLANMLLGLQNELDKLKGRVNDEGQSVNLAQVSEYAGNITDSQNVATIFNASLGGFNELGPYSWIIDTGTTTHMCANPNLFSKLKEIMHYTSVKLPDNRTKQITQEGNIRLCSTIILENVLYVPCFRYNLISVNKLTANTQSRFIFYPNYCLLQDQKTDHVLLKGRAIGKLYVFHMLYDGKNSV